MRYLTILLLVIACSVPSERFSKHGSDITAENAVDINVFLYQVNEEDQEFKVRGTIEEVCQMKACWMTLKNDTGVNIRVTFKDYGFFVPKDISGSEVIIEGVAKKEVLKEDRARHYAEDGGKEYDESMRNSITFVANGVLITEG